VGNLVNLTGNDQVLVDTQSVCTFTISSSDKAVGLKGATIKKIPCEWGNKTNEVAFTTSDVNCDISTSSGNILK
jgi:hypothetical protein